MLTRKSLKNSKKEENKKIVGKKDNESAAAKINGKSLPDKKGKKKKRFTYFQILK